MGDDVWNEWVLCRIMEHSLLGERKKNVFTARLRVEVIIYLLLLVC